jgi:hypothetical protein
VAIAVSVNATRAGTTQVFGPYPVTAWFVSAIAFGNFCRSFFVSRGWTVNSVSQVVV